MIEGKDFDLFLIRAVTGKRNFRIKHSPVQRGKKEDFMNLTRYEQEVVINLNAEEDTATVYTANPAWIRKMAALAEEFPDTFRLIRSTQISRTYEMPKKYVRIGKPRELSAAQKENLEKMRTARTGQQE